MVYRAAGRQLPLGLSGGPEKFAAARRTCGENATDTSGGGCLGGGADRQPIRHPGLVVVGSNTTVPTFASTIAPARAGSGLIQRAVGQSVSLQVVQRGASPSSRHALSDPSRDGLIVAVETGWSECDHDTDRKADGPPTPPGEPSAFRARD
jgi:hypothetical protein